MEQSKFYAKAILAGFLLVLGISILWGSWYTVDQGEVGLILRNKSIEGEAEPGWHLKMPWVDDVYTFSTRSERFQWERVQSFSKDIQTVEFNISVNLQVDPTKVGKIYSVYGNNYADRVVFPQVPVALKDVAGKYTAPELISKRAQFGDDFLARLRARVPPEFTITSVQIDNIDFTDQFEKSIEQAAEMNAQAEKSKNQLVREEAQAKIAVVRAVAAADAAKATGDARAHVIRVQGEANADAIRARAEALKANPELVALTTAERWNGVLPVNMYANSPVPLLNLNK